MKAAPSARTWIAAGVRHELLMRALPAVRHDLAAPLSLMRMQILMLRRHSKADAPAEPEALAQRVAQLDGQVSEISKSLTQLREWEWPTPEGAPMSARTRAALVHESVGLMRSAFELNGVALQVAPALEPAPDPAADEASAAAQATWPDAVGLRYLLLGALCHLHDTLDAAGAGGTIVLNPVQDWGLALQAQPRPARAAGDGAPSPWPAHRAPRHLAIDAASLQALAEDLGCVLTRTPGGLTLDLRRP